MQMQMQMQMRFLYKLVYRTAGVGHGFSRPTGLRGEVRRVRVRRDEMEALSICKTCCSLMKRLAGEAAHDAAAFSLQITGRSHTPAPQIPPPPGQEPSTSVPLPATAKGTLSWGLVTSEYLITTAGGGGGIRALKKEL